VPRKTCYRQIFTVGNAFVFLGHPQAFKFEPELVGLGTLSHAPPRLGSKRTLALWFMNDIIWRALENIQFLLTGVFKILSVSKVDCKRIQVFSLWTCQPTRSQELRTRSISSLTLEFTRRKKKPQYDIHFLQWQLPFTSIDHLGGSLSPAQPVAPWRYS
jgi:hypothetical protein